MTGFRISKKANVEADYVRIQAWCKKYNVPFNRLFNNVILALAREINVDNDYDDLVPVVTVHVRIPSKIGSWVK